MDKEPVRSAEEESFIKNGGEIKTYKVSKKEMDAIIAEIMDRKIGVKQLILVAFVDIPKRIFLWYFFVDEI